MTSSFSLSGVKSELTKNWGEKLGFLQQRSVHYCCRCEQPHRLIQNFSHSKIRVKLLLRDVISLHLSSQPPLPISWKVCFFWQYELTISTLYWLETEEVWWLSNESLLDLDEEFDPNLRTEMPWQKIYRILDVKGTQQYCWFDIPMWMLGIMKEGPLGW